MDIIASTQFNCKDFSNALAIINKLVIAKKGEVVPLITYVRVTSSYLEYIGWENYAKANIAGIELSGNLDVVISIKGAVEVLKAVKNKGTFHLLDTSEGTIIIIGDVRHNIPSLQKTSWCPNEDSKPKLVRDSWLTFEFNVLEKCVPFVCTGEDRPSLLGIYVNNMTKTVTASDGFRLIEVQLDNECFANVNLNDSYLIPTSLVKALKGTKGKVDVYKTILASGQLGYVWIETVIGIFAWICEARNIFPEYHKLFDGFIHRIDFYTDISNLLKISSDCLLTLSDSSMKIEAYVEEDVIASQVIDVLVTNPYVSKDGKPFQIRLNSSYLLACLAVCEQGAYNFSYKAYNHPLRCDCQVDTYNAIVILMSKSK
jgi:hypothetical protein